MIVMEGSRAPPPSSGTSAPLYFPSLNPKTQRHHHSILTRLTADMKTDACGTVRRVPALKQLVLVVALVTPAPLLLPH